ncbi:CCR4-NOT transcription complex subunit 10-like isoform X2 [Anneissia japonica]|uniref:CCR4-NOT transcription complex subunit 10-like isoform X2 n=1 Tax=Anneissia japonica TaxID=1529436 RepID=UPI0014258E25|nr:CCR4-NOT transcription complex subunit 10-like isoform X2 [Anneissia japonica]
MDAVSLRETTSSPGLPMISSEEKELAHNASESFKVGNYQLCVEQLKKLSNTRKHDPKVDHNLAVAQFYMSGCKNTDEFRNNLTQASKLAQLSLNDLESLEDVEQGVFFFNHAVILFHLHQYQDTIRILEKMFQILEPLVETLAHDVLLLLVETFLRNQQADRALFYLNYLEKVLLGQDPAPKQSQASDQQSGKEATENSNSTSEKYEMHKAVLNKCKTRCFLGLRSMKACKRELKHMMNSSGSTATTLFMKSNFEYLRQNYRKAIKFLNSAPQSLNFHVTGECISAMYFNNISCVHFHLRKYNLGTYYARRAIQENLSAVQEIPKKQGCELSGRPLKTLGMNRHFELLFNMGIQLLHAGQPLSAFDCLIEVVQIFPSNPRLWLRIAECCILVHKQAEIKGNSKKDDDKRRGIVEKVVGTGIYRKVVLLRSASMMKNYSCSSGQSAAMPEATLDFASLCLCNALNLLECDWQNSATPLSKTSGSETDSTDSHSPKQHGFISDKPAPPSQPLKGSEVISLRCSILVCSAYVKLCLGDFTCALEYAGNLLNQSELSGSLRYLGHMYCAEALINMDKISEAIKHLSFDNVSDVRIQYQGDQGSDKEKNDNSTDGEASEQRSTVAMSYPASLQTAKATMAFNLATAFCIRGEMDKAKRCIMQACAMIPHSEVPPQALLLAIAIELQCGSTQLALQMVKKQQLIPYYKAPEYKHIDPTIILPPANLNHKPIGMPPPSQQLQSQRPIGTPGQGGFRPIGQPVGHSIGQSFGLPLGQPNQGFGQANLGQSSPLLGSIPMPGPLLVNTSQGNLLAPGQGRGIFSPLDATKPTWKDAWK